MNSMIKTLKVRVKDKHIKLLLDMAKQVNFVWNYINELSSRSIYEKRKWLSNYDIQKYTNGCAKELGLHSQTVQQISKEYVTRRNQFKKTKLMWRKSYGKKRSLGWIPINTGAATWKNGQIYYNGHYFKVWNSWGLSNYRFKSASFNEDSRGRWYFNVVVEVKTNQPCNTNTNTNTNTNSIINIPNNILGIDLGLKNVATTSNGEKLIGRWYRQLEKALGIAQRAKKKNRVRAIQAKIANCRKDEIHKFTTKIVRDSLANNITHIYVGDLSSSKLVKTKMAKSVLDAGLSFFKTTLEYKCHQAGVVFSVINENYTTQTCSCCGEIPDSSPKGRTDLGIRQWSCSKCGTVHDRDINAALNIAAHGHMRLAGGIPVL